MKSSLNFCKRRKPASPMLASHQPPPKIRPLDAWLRRRRRLTAPGSSRSQLREKICATLHLFARLDELETLRRRDRIGLHDFCVLHVVREQSRARFKLWSRLRSKTFTHVTHRRYRHDTVRRSASNHGCGALRIRGRTGIDAPRRASTGNGVLRYQLRAVVARIRNNVKSARRS